jgi:hypothetical protein
MNRYEYPNFKRPRAFLGFIIGDRVVNIRNKAEHGVIAHMEHKTCFVNWDKPKPLDHPYVAGDLEHE